MYIYAKTIGRLLAVFLFHGVVSGLMLALARNRLRKAVF